MWTGRTENVRSLSNCIASITSCYAVFLVCISMHSHFFLNAMLTCHPISSETRSRALDYQSSQSSSPLLIEIKRIPAQRASASIARLEPLEQTASMEHVLARRAALLRQLSVSADDAVANRTLGLAFEGAGDVAAERGDAVGDGAVL
jgi:hypothetical protein